MLPDEVYAIVEAKLNSVDVSPVSARVQMSLLDILSGEFFNDYIKTGASNYAISRQLDVLRRCQEISLCDQKVEVELMTCSRYTKVITKSKSR